jgi:glycosyltransferase involved in cell wall biosynthesis
MSPDPSAPCGMLVEIPPRPSLADYEAISHLGRSGAAISGWRPVLSNTRAVGPRQQITHACDGWLIDDPEDRGQIADALDYLLNEAVDRAALARTAQRRAHDQFMIFSQLRDWLGLLEELANGRGG